MRADDGTDAGGPAPRRPVAVRSGSVVGFVALVILILAAAGILVPMVSSIVAAAAASRFGLGAGGATVIHGLLLLGSLVLLVRLFVSFARNLHSGRGDEHS